MGCHLSCCQTCLMIPSPPWDPMVREPQERLERRMALQAPMVPERLPVRAIPELQ